MERHTTYDLADFLTINDMPLAMSPAEAFAALADLSVIVATGKATLLHTHTETDEPTQWIVFISGTVMPYSSVESRRIPLHEWAEAWFDPNLYSG